MELTSCMCGCRSWQHQRYRIREGQPFLRTESACQHETRRLGLNAGTSRARVGKTCGAGVLRSPRGQGHGGSSGLTRVCTGTGPGTPLGVVDYRYLTKTTLSVGG